MSRKVPNSLRRGATSASVLVFLVGLFWPAGVSAQVVEARARIDGMS